MPRGPESFGGGGESNEADQLRSEYQARGEEANEVAIKADEADKKEQEKNFNVSPAEVLNKLKKSPAARRVIGFATLSAATVALVATIVTINASRTNAANSVITNSPSQKPKVMTEQAMVPVSTPQEVTNITFEGDENTQFAGETINGVKYDYTEYADRDNKESYNAYGYDYSDQYGNREEATKGIMHMAEQEPEALASYAYNILTDDEKQELGIKGMSMVEIDNKFDQTGGGALQQSLKDKLNQILNDQEKTSFKFYHENDTEDTNYIYFVDENEDGNYTPDELHLGYDTKKRNNAPQVDISRTIKNADGAEKTVKMLDLNMKCGYQPNYEKAPQGVPKIESNKPVPQVIAGGGPSVNPGGSDPTPTPTPTPKPTPTPTPTPTPPGPTPTPTPKPKDAENLKRIDDEINKDIAGDIGTGIVDPGYNPGVSPEDITAPPSKDDYEGTQPTIVPNQPSTGGEDVQPTAPENDYGDDRGGANDGNSNDNPVQDNDEGQRAADENEQTNPPTSGDDLEDVLGDLGIN